jgi:3D-(3,5/4)-trihydroxycyclohexane-1,2-dione acylhydrolase (decyclizing)
MENADLLIAIGTRAVCQSDCSRTGYPNAKRVINVNASLEDATHYHHTLALVGDVQRTLLKLNQALGPGSADKQEWLKSCSEKKKAWQVIKAERECNPILEDE